MTDPTIAGPGDGALAEARALLATHPAVDLHTDTILRSLHGVDAFRSGPGGMHAGPPQLVAGGVGTAVYAFWIEAYLGPDRGWSRVLAMYEELRRVRERCTGAERKLSLRPALEDGRVLLGDGSPGTLRERVAALSAMGACYVTYTWNTGNAFATSCEDTRAGVGLTAAGIELTHALDEVGIRVDVSHLSDRAAFEVIDRARRPPIASHSSARAICPHRRNVSDELARRIAERGGVIGVNVHRPFLSVAPGDATLRDVVAHVEHLWRVAGEEAVAIGTDFDGVPVGPAGFEDATRFPHLVAELLRRGHDASRLVRLVSRNARERVLEPGLPAGASA